MTTKYLVSASRSSIQKVEVLRETTSSIFSAHPAYPKGRCIPKRSDSPTGDNYFNTWEEARDYLIACAESNILDLEFQLSQAKGWRATLDTMEDPDVLRDTHGISMPR
jgi:hypothetical protein